MITNKPLDTDPIVEEQRDPLGGVRLVMTRAFSRYLDDLSRLQNQTPDDPQANTTHERAQQRQSTQRVETLSQSNSHEMTALKSELRATKQALKQAEIQQQSAAHEIQSLKSQINTLERQMKDILSRLSNVEQTAWR